MLTRLAGLALALAIATTAQAQSFWHYDFVATTTPDGLTPVNARARVTSPNPLYFTVGAGVTVGSRFFDLAALDQCSVEFTLGVPIPCVGLQFDHPLGGLYVVRLRYGSNANEPSEATYQFGEDASPALITETPGIYRSRFGTFGGTVTVTRDAVVAPEPSTIVLLAAGLGLLAWRRRYTTRAVIAP